MGMSGAVLWLGVGAGLTSFLIGAVVRLWSGFLGLVAIPNSRSLHVTPRPLGGGLGIVAGTVGGVLLLRPIGVEAPLLTVVGLVGGGLIVAAVSFVDDLRSLSAGFRLTIHLGAAVFAVCLIGPLSVVGIVPVGLVPEWVAVPFTVFWIVAITNIYNFMDGVDGLAGVQAVSTTSAWAFIGWWLGSSDLLAIGVLMASTSMGFLVHNWNPARLFMGDVGSAFLGYSIAVTTVAASQQHAVLSVAGPLLLWPFIFDATFTLIRRACRGENILRAHRSHLYQRLVAAGWGHRAVCGLYLMMAALAAVAGVAIAIGLPSASILAIVYVSGSVLLVGRLVIRAEAAYSGDA